LSSITNRPPAFTAEGISARAAAGWRVRARRARRIVWSRSSATRRFSSRTTAGRAVEQCAPEGGAEGGQQRSGDPPHHSFELGSLGVRRGPRCSGRGQQPGQGGPDYAPPNQGAPTLQGARRNDLWRVDTRLCRPFAGRRDSVAQHVHHGLEYRADGEAAAPQLGRHQRGRAAVAEAHPADRHRAEHVAAGKIGDLRAVAKAVRSHTARRAAPPAGDARRRHHRHPSRPRGWERAQVVLELESE